MQSCGRGLSYCVIWPVDSAGRVERLLDPADTEPMASGVRIPQEMPVEPVLDPPGGVFACGIMTLCAGELFARGFFRFAAGDVQFRDQHGVDRKGGDLAADGGVDALF